MNRLTFIKKLKSLKLIAHRLGYAMTDYPENSLIVLQTIFKTKKMLNACEGFEFDICFTKDHVPIVMHDKYLDDISDSEGLIKSYNINDLRKIKFGFRKSLGNKNSFKFAIVTLEELLTFFSSNKKLLKNKIIKIETKVPCKISKKNMQKLADVINMFPDLSKNLIHLSFWPQNLVILKKLQKQNNNLITKTDLLCDYSFIVKIAKMIKSLDYISLRIKAYDLAKINKTNSIRVNINIFISNFLMFFSNAINEKNLKYSIDKYGSVGLYVLNNDNDIDQVCKLISEQFFLDNYKKIIFTTDNPLCLKNVNK